MLRGQGIFVSKKTQISDTQKLKYTCIYVSLVYSVN